MDPFKILIYFLNNIATYNFIDILLGKLTSSQVSDILAHMNSFSGDQKLL